MRYSTYLNKSTLVSRRILLCNLQSRQLLPKMFYIIGPSWTKPTLILYSEQATLPVLQRGDFIVGNRRLFYKLLMPHAQVPARIKGGHVIMYDNPKAVAYHIKKFIGHWPFFLLLTTPCYFLLVMKSSVSSGSVWPDLMIYWTLANLNAFGNTWFAQISHILKEFL